MTDAAPSAIGTRAARGGLLYIARNTALQLIQVVSAIVLARALVPADYGAFALAATLVGAARTVGDLGLTQTLVVRSDFEESDLQASAGIALPLAVVLAVAVGLAGFAFQAGLISSQEGAGLLTAVYGGVLIVDMLRLAPIIRLTRELRFREIAVATSAESIAMYVVQTVLLLAGVGIWSLVAGQYARSLAGLLTYRRLGGALARPRRTTRTRRLLKDGLPYQGPLILGGIAGLLVPVIVAAGLDARGLGLWAWSTVLAVPVVQSLLAVQSVLMPSLARLREAGRERFDLAGERSLRLVGLATGASAGALIGLAPDIVREVFGSQWTDATGAVQATLLGIIPLAATQVLSASLDARGEARARFRCSVVAAFASVVACYPLIELGGITGAACASAIVGPAIDTLLLLRIAEIRGGRWTLNAVGVLVVVGTISALAGHAVGGLLVLILVSLAVGACAFVIAWAVDPAVARYTLGLVRARGSA